MSHYHDANKNVLYPYINVKPMIVALNVIPPPLAGAIALKIPSLAADKLGSLRNQAQNGWEEQQVKETSGIEQSAT